MPRGGCLHPPPAAAPQKGSSRLPVALSPSPPLTAPDPIAGSCLAGGGFHFTPLRSRLPQPCGVKVESGCPGEAPGHHPGVPARLGALSTPHRVSGCPQVWEGSAPALPVPFLRFSGVGGGSGFFTETFSCSRRELSRLEQPSRSRGWSVPSGQVPSSSGTGVRNKPASRLSAAVPAAASALSVPAGWGVLPGVAPKALLGVSCDGAGAAGAAALGAMELSPPWWGGATRFQPEPPPAEPARSRKKVFPVHLLTQSSWGDGEVGRQPAAVQRAGPVPRGDVGTPPLSPCQGLAAPWGGPGGSGQGEATGASCGLRGRWPRQL